MLNAEQFAELDKQNLRTQTVKVLGDEVLVKSMTLVEKDAMDEAFMLARKNGKTPPYRAYLISTCVVDAEGKPVFTLGQANRISGKAGEVLLKAIGELNAVTEEDVKELEKN